MFKFKVGDKVVVVAAWGKPLWTETYYVVSDSLNWGVVPNKEVLISRDPSNVGPSNSTITDIEDLEHEHIYNSPLYRAMS